MNHWERLELRESLLRDLAKFIQEDDYGTVPSYDPRIHELDYEFGKKMKFSSGHPELTIRQRRAADLLMQLGLCGVAQARIELTEDEAVRRDAEQSAVVLERDLPGLVQRYAACLTDEERKLLLLAENKSAQQEPLQDSERNSLLKLVIGMAVKGYCYDPTASRNDAVSDITKDLEKLGISLSDDTVRKYLKQAAEKLPPKP